MHHIFIALLFGVFGYLFAEKITIDDQLKKLQIPDNRAQHIWFGFVGDQTGHFKKYNHQIELGIQACFTRINKAGGIKNKTLHLACLNDYGDPQIHQQAVNELNRQYNISMFIGNMGTRGIKQFIPQIKNKELLFLFPWGGDEQLRKADLKGIINGLGYLEPQIDALVHFITQTLLISNIGIFHADGEFSEKAARYCNNLLLSKSIIPSAISSYNRYTLDIGPKSVPLINADPRLVISLSTSMPTVKLIRHFFKEGHYGTTFAGIDSTLFVKDILINRMSAYYFTSVVPDARTDDRAIAQKFRTDYHEIAPDHDCTELAFSYYIGASCIAHALATIDDSHDHHKIIEEFEKMSNLDIDGFPVSFDQATRHLFGLKNIFIIKR